MSAVDRIRSRIDQNDYRIGSGLPVSAPVPLTVQEAEALCDLAEFARILHPHPACPSDCPACAALARLDREGDREHSVPVTKEAPLAKGDVLASNPCEVTVTHSAINDVGRREVWGRCGHCRIAHPIDWKLFERGRGPWVRVARAASDTEAVR